MCEVCRVVCIWQTEWGGERKYNTKGRCPSLLTLHFEKYEWQMCLSSTHSPLLKYEFSGSLFDSTNSAASLEAEEEEFYITTTEILYKIHLCNQEPEFKAETLRYLDGSASEPVASEPGEAASNLEEITGWPPVSMVRNTDWCECCCCCSVCERSIAVRCDS